MRTNKQDQLLALGRKRKEAHLDGYSNLADLTDGAYECNFVSPYTKTAGNVDSKIFVFLQDWGSRDSFPEGGTPNPETQRLGYTPSVNTNRNLQELLSMHFGASLAEIYASNVFPLIKPGGMSNRIPRKHLEWAVTEFALPQVEIVKPLLVILLGKATFNAFQTFAGGKIATSLNDAIESPFDYAGAKVWCQAHTGWGARHRGSRHQINLDWSMMAKWYRGVVQA